MSEMLSLDHFGIKEGGPTLTLGLGRGGSLGIIGPAASGKSRFLRAACGLEKSAQGTVHLQSEAFYAEPLPKRTRIQSLVREHREAADHLMALGLWEVRHKTMGDLCPAQAAAATLAHAFVEPAAIVALDGLFDHLDPWVFEAARDILHRKAAAGCTILATTVRPEVLKQFETIVVLRSHEVRFAGSIEELLRRSVPHDLIVETQHHAGVRAIAAAFEVSVEETPLGVRMSTPNGQELAARLLLEGYGDVKFVLHRAPSLDEALRSIQ